MPCGAAPARTSLRLTSDAVDAATVHTLAGCEWTERSQPLCPVGDCGTGKSPMLTTLGATEAATAGCRVMCVSAAKLVNELVEVADENQLSKTIARYGRVGLFRIDEPGSVELDRRGPASTPAVCGPTRPALLAEPGLPAPDAGPIAPPPARPTKRATVRSAVPAAAGRRPVGPAGMGPERPRVRCAVRREGCAVRGWSRRRSVPAAGGRFGGGPGCRTGRRRGRPVEQRPVPGCGPGRRCGARRGRRGRGDVAGGGPDAVRTVRRRRRHRVPAIVQGPFVSPLDRSWRIPCSGRRRSPARGPQWGAPRRVGP
ncbi:ATP-binding protein [Streptomyces sp. NPDC088745]|uniref:ATP-binding protein n=1 Tax=Streptomyces sp. NPDC088745 TaxID=3365884 RepID=UPI0038193901